MVGFSLTLSDGEWLITILLIAIALGIWFRRR